jgi:Ca-activated chloride channel homolog
VRKDGQSALVVFSGDPFVVTPLTDDVETIKALLPVLDTNLMPSTGQHVSKAIAKATELFAQAGRSNGSILLVTSALASKEIATIAESALKAGINISILGVGTDENAPIPKRNGGFVTDDKGALVITTLAKDNLNQLAKRTQGIYTTISVDDSDILLLAQHLSNLHASHTQEEMTSKQTKWHDQGYLFVILALPLFCLFFRKGVLLSLCLLLPYTLQASAWNDFFKTRDQRAEVLFQEENYQKAKNVFINQEWKGAANFRLGEYEAAAENFQANQTAEGLYNFGTAKAKQGDFKSALQAYTAALEIEPDHEDALYNKKLIEDWHKEQQDQEKQEKQDQDKQDQENTSDDQQQKDQQGQGESEQDQKQDKQNQSNEQQQNDEKKDEQDQPKSKDEAAEKELENQYKDQLEKEIEKGEQQKEEQPVAQNESPPDDPQRQKDDRWLQRIPDDPGALLRRKFLHQYKNQR